MPVDPHLDAGVQPEAALVEGDQRLFRRGEDHALPRVAGLRFRQVVASQHLVLRRGDDGGTARGREDVVARQHQDARLELGIERQRHMHGHLVAVEVGVERRADHRMDPDRLAFHQHRLERLDAEAMQRRGPVQKHRMPVDDMLEDLPDLGSLLVHHLLGALDGLHHPALDELANDERLEELDGHVLRETAFMEPQLGSDHDHRAAGIVHALAEKVLAEAPLLALEHVGQRFERAVIVAPHRVDPPRVVKEGVDRLLQHPLLIPEDDVAGTGR